ncbi:MAG: hypothetical protein ACTTJ7_01865 [Treponema sp.]
MLFTKNAHGNQFLSEGIKKDEKVRLTMDSVTQTERGHGRIETRSAYTTADVEWQMRRQGMAGT